MAEGPRCRTAGGGGWSGYARRMARAWVSILMAISVAGCGRSRSPVDNAERALAAVPPDAAGGGPADAAARSVGPAIAARGDHCQADADCGWDDPCVATRCGARVAPTAIACDESAPPPGTCSCVERQCTLRPTDAGRGASAPGCTRDADCGLDVGRAACVLGGTTMIGPIAEQGPVCTCAASGRCEWSWAGPVPCTSWRDCSWTMAPRLRPVPSTQVPRPVDHPVKACQDGERDSVCSPAHTCQIVAWGC